MQDSFWDGRRIRKGECLWGHCSPRHGKVCSRRWSAKEIVDVCCVCEKSVYMPDFITDEEGNLQEVRYDEVKKW